MLRKTVLLLVVMAACSSVRATEPYVGGGINYTTLKDARNGGFSIEGVGGATLGEALRGEVALGFNRENIKGSTIKIWEVFGNLYYDINRESKVVPYVLAGIGLGSAGKGDLFGSSSRDTAMLGQVGAGIAIPVSESLMIDIKYRYQMSPDYHVSGTSSFKLTAHQLGVGIRYMF